MQTNVIGISFGAKEWAQAWVRETAPPFPLLFDPDRQAYRAYGLERSILRSWSLNNILYYLKAILLQGRTLSGYRGDPNQLGGDFIIDAQGIVRLAYPSRDPTDRPAIDKIVATLETLK